MSEWIVGIASGLIGLFGVILASRAVDLGIAICGFGLFGFGLIMVFQTMKQSFDAAERAEHAGARTPAQDA